MSGLSTISVENMVQFLGIGVSLNNSRFLRASESYLAASRPSGSSPRKRRLFDRVVQCKWNNKQIPAGSFEAPREQSGFGECFVHDFL